MRASRRRYENDARQQTFMQFKPSLRPEQFHARPSFPPPSWLPPINSPSIVTTSSRRPPRRDIEQTAVQRCLMRCVMTARSSARLLMRGAAFFADARYAGASVAAIA